MPKDRALGWLARREYSYLELLQRLKRDAGLESDEAELLAQWFVEHDLQSDHRVTESYIRMQLGKCRGPLKIRFELRQRGVRDELINEGLSDINWHELADQRLQAKFGGVADNTAEKAREKISKLSICCGRQPRKSESLVVTVRNGKAHSDL